MSVFVDIFGKRVMICTQNHRKQFHVEQKVLHRFIPMDQY